MQLEGPDGAKELIEGQHASIALLQPPDPIPHALDVVLQQFNGLFSCIRVTWLHTRSLVFKRCRCWYTSIAEVAHQLAQILSASDVTFSLDPER